MPRIDGRFGPISRIRPAVILIRPPDPSPAAQKTAGLRRSREGNLTSVIRKCRRTFNEVLAHEITPRSQQSSAKGKVRAHLRPEPGNTTAAVDLEPSAVCAIKRQRRHGQPRAANWADRNSVLFARADLQGAPVRPNTLLAVLRPNSLSHHLG
jgi:hypothetical protein